MKKSSLNFKRIFVGLFFTLQIIASAAILSSPLPALAQSEEDIQTPIQFTPQIGIPSVGIPGSGFNVAPTPVGTFDVSSGKMISNLLPRYIRSLYNYGLAIAGILATIVLMGGGVIWMMSGGDSGKVSQAKELITGSISGLLILVVAWIILNTINPNLVNLKGIETQVVKKVAYCCDSTKGNIPMDKDGKCTSGILCTNGSICTNTNNSSDSAGNSFICINKADYGCCEWKKLNHPDELYCQSNPINQACPKTSPKVGYEYGTYYKSWCETGAWVGTMSCLDKPTGCQDKKNGTPCRVNDTQNGACYNSICWAGKGKKDEPCGKEDNAKCMEGNLSCPSPYFWDKFSSGRDCDGISLTCCFSASK